MNEELRIIIRAVTDEARRNIAAVREELEGVDDSSQEASKAVDTAMSGMAKGTLAAVAAFTALTAAMVTLGKSAQEVQKGFGKINTSFEAAGSNAKEATKHYRELFGVLGDHDRAIETGQSLSRITTDKTALSDYENIVAGAVAKYGDGYNSEALAENIAEAIAGGQLIGDLERVFVEAGISVDGFNATLAQTVGLEEREALIRSTLNSVLGEAGKLYIANNQATIQYNKSQADLNLTLAQASGYTTPLLTSLNELSTTLLTFLSPALQTVATYLTAFIQLIAEAIQWVGGFFGMFSSSGDTVTANINGYKNAMTAYQNQMRKAFGGTNSELDENLKKINAVKKATMGFDELNVVSSQTSASVGGGGGGGGTGVTLPTAPDPADYGIGGSTFDFSNLTKGIDEATKKIEGLLVLVGIVGGSLLLWKITDFVVGIKDSLNTLKSLRKVLNWSEIGEAFDAGRLTEAEGDAVQHLNKIQTQIKTIGGYMATIAGVMLLISGYTDAWANGVDWGNLALMIGGVALAVGGLALAFPGVIAQVNLFGSTLKLTMAQIALFVAGIALMVLGVVDFINNGPTLQNTILIIGGAIAVAVALATAGLSVVISAIVAAVAAVAAFTAAILLEKPAIMSVQEAQENLTAAKEAAAEAEMGYVNAVDAAEGAMNRLKDAEAAAGITGAELYKQVQNGTLDYADMTDAQKEVYKAYLDNEKKQKELEESTKALNEAKKAETIASYENQLALAKESGNYDEFKKSVVAAFEAGELSADEARELIGKSMSEMSDDSQKTFMEDIPGDIKNGLDPSKYETTRKKIGDWFKQAGKDIGTWFTDSLWKPIKDWWNNSVKPIFTKKFWSDKFSAIKDGAKAGLNGAIGVVEKAMNWIIKKINTLSWDIPDWVPLVGGEKFGFNFKTISIPRLATGGIVTSSVLANIGEAGREAVLPLENNTEWMNVLADRIASRNNTPSKIVLMLDGRELGWASINSINGITKQTGNLQLALV